MHKPQDVLRMVLVDSDARVLLERNPELYQTDLGVIERLRLTASRGQHPMVLEGIELQHLTGLAAPRPMVLEGIELQHLPGLVVLPLTASEEQELPYQMVE